MLEIAILVGMGKSIAGKARDKGRRGTPYVLLLLGLWFGGEILGAIVVAVATAATSGNGEPDMLLTYLGALGFAVLGAVIAFMIVGALQPVHDEHDEWE